MNEACFDCWAIEVIAWCRMEYQLQYRDDLFTQLDLIREANAYDGGDGLSEGQE